MKKRIEFPLLELTLIIMLLSMVAFVALPKWMDVGSEARIKMLNATALNISSINRLLYSRALIKNVHNSALQSSDILGEKDAGVYLVYGELRAQKIDFKKYINSALIAYAKTDKPGELRLYLENYRNEACYINYQQAYPKLNLDGKISIQKARSRIKSTGC